MLDLTDRHCRFFHRLLTKKSLLYTEMVTTGAIVQGEQQRFLAFDEIEKPIAFQLGGSNSVDLASCTRIIEACGYDEVNLNVGCPSDRVQNGRFGACLMADPDLVAECVYAMRQVASIPVTVKSRIGIDEQDSYEELVNFIASVAHAGCNTFIIHARKAWLKGLSPKQNRVIPPLRYDFVYQIKKDFPDLEIILNGGVTSLKSAKEISQHVDGVMIGREVYHNPYLLAGVDAEVFAVSNPVKRREAIIMELIPYIQQQLVEGQKLHSITRHVLGLFHGVPGAKKWRRILSENAAKQGADETVVLDALSSIT